MKTKNAFSYLRFSTPEQSLGDSERRQLGAAQAYCERNGLRLVEGAADRGLSAFHGRNHSNGALGALLKRMRPGDTLIVEDCDRWSREPVLESLNRLQAEVRKGIEVVFLRTGTRVNASNFNDLGRWFRPFSPASSRTKRAGRRASASKHPGDEKRKALKAGKPVELSCQPKWLTWQDGKALVNKEKASVVMDIFARAARGETVIEILRALQPLKRSANGLRRLLRDKAVLGYCNLVDPPAKVWPAIIPEPVFYAVQAGRKNVIHHVTVRHGNHTNLFSGLVRCQVCGERVVCQWSGHRDDYRVSLRCSGPRTGRSKCRSSSVPLALVETGVLALLGDSGLIGPLLAVQGKASRLGELEGRLDAAKREVAKLAKLIFGDSEPSPTVYAGLKAAEGRAELASIELEAERERLKTERPAAQAYDEFSAALPALAADPSKRGALRLAIGQVIERMTLDPAGTKGPRPGQWPFRNAPAGFLKHGPKRRQWRINVQVRGAKEPVGVWLFGHPVNGWIFQRLRS